ncbi:MAG TPA: leucine-rich repeat domain-containing protein [Candidatus Blautia ornithocaccae]|nr:leucine-rich repeat domain-containing protein [Candidatus Blautia ornithocaccae]
MTIPDGVTTLSYSAFQGNQTVVSVVIPNSVTEIQSYAFMNCPCLEEVRKRKHN